MKEISYLELFKTIKKVLEFMEENSTAHGLRVCYLYQRALRERKGISEREIALLTLTAFLHDIGRYGAGQNGYGEEAARLFGYFYFRELFFVPQMADLLFYADTRQQERIASPLKEEIVLFWRCHDIVRAMERGEAYVMDTLLNQEADFLLNLEKKYGVTGKLKGGGCEKELSAFLRRVTAKRRDVVDFLKFLTYFAGFENASYIAHIVTAAEAGVFLSGKYGFDREEQAFMEIICLVHDIGKVYIPKEILQKPHALSEEERKIVSRHADYTRQILEELGFSRVSGIAASHHERLDGSGYPKGMIESGIDPYSKILAVADIISALSLKRCYKEAMDKEKTCRILRELAETGKIDRQITHLAIKHYDELAKRMDPKENPVLIRYRQVLAEREACLSALAARKRR